MVLLFGFREILIYQQSHNNADCMYCMQLVVKTAARYIFPALYFRGGNQTWEVRKYKLKQEAVMLSEAMSHNRDNIYLSLPR